MSCPFFSLDYTNTINCLEDQYCLRINILYLVVKQAGSQCRRIKAGYVVEPGPVIFYWCHLSYISVTTYTNAANVHFSQLLPSAFYNEFRLKQIQKQKKVKRDYCLSLEHITQWYKGKSSNSAFFIHTTWSRRWARYAGKGIADLMKMGVKDLKTSSPPLF